MKLVLASHNKNKIREIKAVLADSGITGIELLSLSDIGFEGDIEENGTTFEENAVIKAQVPASYGYCGIADDSGLEVDCLDGRPGVYSARFAGEPCDDDRNNQKLMEEIKTVPDEQCTARFVSVIAFVDPACPEHNFTVRGTCEGRIIKEARGHDGFGYDPYFYLPSLGKTYAELTVEEKNGVSHRGKAMRQFAEKIRETYFPDGTVEE